MSRHEGVSCDSCLIGNFRGKRYKCLICYDYDLCTTCYEAGATTTRHTTEHPMQCILTRTDFDLYYGGEAVSVEQPQSFTCPFCGRMGFTESTLQDHVSAEHSDTSFEVVCPVCAALPGGDPNLVTDDFAAHLTLEHRGSRDLEEPSSSRHVRRIPHPGRGVGATRARRSNTHFSSSGGLASLSPSSRDSMDPIAELLSQLSGVRRGGGGGGSQSSTTAQLQQIQMQLQLERQQAQVARQQLERLPRRSSQLGGGLGGSSGASGGTASAASNAAAAAMSVQPAVVLEPARPAVGSGQFLLSRCADACHPEGELQQSEVDRADRSFFVRELLVNALVEGLHLQSKPVGTVLEKAPALPSSPKECDGHFLAAVGDVAAPLCVPRVENCKKTLRAAPREQQQPPPPPPQQQQQQQQHGGNGRAASPRVMPSAGTGTVREVSPVVSQGVPTGRIPVRSGTSPSSSTRRKLVRHLDGRNQPNEPPPPH